VDDPDAIWKPGYEGPVPIVGSVADVVEESSPQPPDRESPARRSRRRRWWWFGAVVVVVTLVAVVVAVDPLGTGDVPASEGPGDRRLPQSVTELWSVDIGDIGDHWVEVIGRDLVIAAVATIPPVATTSSVTTLLAFDALTGEQRWAFPIDARPDEVAVAGAVGDVLLVEQPVEQPTVIGIDMATGETLPPAELTADIAISESTDEPVSVGSRIAVSGSNFVITAPGSISGVVVEGDTERWSILGSGPVVVGDRIVARATSTDGQLRISAYGDAD
jgi:hypothetical protein